MRSVRLDFASPHSIAPAIALASLVSLALPACSASHSQSIDGDGWGDGWTDTPTASADDEPDHSAATPTTPPSTPPPTTEDGGVVLDPNDFGDHPEVVSVFMADHDGARWICTGTVISRTEVVTAAHCLDPAEFVRWDIVAPQVVGKPRLRGESVRIFGGTYEDVANPDLGILTLRDPIDLPTYAVLTDVVAHVEAGDVVTGGAIVRTRAEANAPFTRTADFAVSSTVEFGYEHGFGTPMFSKGGDSGAGLFLVENGQLTHKLIGVARQPEPVRTLDHFTRVDASLLAWRAAGGVQ